MLFSLISIFLDEWRLTGRFEEGGAVKKASVERVVCLCVYSPGGSSSSCERFLLLSDVLNDKMLMDFL